MCVCVKVPIRPTCSSVKVDGTQAVMKICQPHSTVAKALPHDALQSCLLNAGVSIDRPVAPRCSLGTDRGGGRFSSGRNRATMSPNWGQERGKSLVAATHTKILNHFSWPVMPSDAPQTCTS